VATSTPSDKGGTGGGLNLSSILVSARLSLPGPLRLIPSPFNLVHEPWRDYSCLKPLRIRATSTRGWEATAGEEDIDRGVADFPQLLKALRDVKFSRGDAWVSIAHCLGGRGFDRRKGRVMKLLVDTVSANEGLAHTRLGDYSPG